MNTISNRIYQAMMSMDAQMKMNDSTDVIAKEEGDEDDDEDDEEDWTVGRWLFLMVVFDAFLS